RSPAARTRPNTSPCKAAAGSASPPERLRSLGSGGSSSDGLTRCQISVNSLPASRPPATLLGIDKGKVRGFDSAVMTTAFPPRRSLNVELEHVLVLRRAVYLRGSDDG